MSGWNPEQWFLLFAGAAVKSTAVLAVAWLAAFFLRRRSAAVRHLVWTGAAAAILALPFLSVSLPAVRIPGVAGLLPASTTVTFSADASATAETAARGTAERPAAMAPGAASGLPDWRTMLMLLWAAGAAAVLARMLAAWRALRRIRRSARPFSDSGLAGALARALGIRHAVDVLETGNGSMPMTFGILRPAVFLPSEAAEWSEEHRRIVLLHELAHVRRGDAATHLLARVAFALVWWNPLAWAGWRAFLRERERATDDMVLNAGARASDYASHLLEVARALRCAPAIGWAAVTMARRPQIEGRLRAILDGGIRRKSMGRAPAMAAVALAVGLAAPLAAVQARGEDAAQAAAADVEVAIRAAVSQKNHEMLESAAKAAERSGKYEIAQRLLEAAAAIRAEVSGEESAVHGIGLLKLAAIESKRGMSQAAESHYARAAQILGERPEAAVALLRLGIAAVIKKEFAAAIGYFERAQRLDSGRAGTALMWMGVARQQEGNISEAERYYTMAVAAQDPKSPEAVTIGRVYSGFLRRQGRNEEASELEARTAEWQKANAARVQKSVAGDVHRIGGSVTPPLLVHKQEPEYSEEARAARLQGPVVLYAEVGVDGLAHNVQVVRGLGLGLDENAVDAVCQWRFKPGMREGQPVTVAATIEVNYRLY
jgi:TonB family protein